MATFLLYAPDIKSFNSTRVNAVLASGADEAAAREAATAVTGNGESMPRASWSAVQISAADLPAPLHPAVRFLGRALLATDPMPGK